MARFELEIDHDCLDFVKFHNSSHSIKLETVVEWLIANVGIIKYNAHDYSYLVHGFLYNPFDTVIIYGEGWSIVKFHLSQRIFVIVSEEEIMVELLMVLF